MGASLVFGFFVLFFCWGGRAALLVAWLKGRAGDLRVELLGPLTEESDHSEALSDIGTTPFI